MRRLGVLAALLLAVVLISTSTADVRADDPPEFIDSWSLGDLELDKSGKVNFDLLQLYNEYHAFISSPEADGWFQPSNPLLQVEGDRVYIEAIAQNNSGDLHNQLRGLGIRGSARAGHAISGQLPILEIKAIGRLGQLNFARPAYMATHSGSVTSQGDHSMRADFARANFGVDGTGIVIGTLSDSYDCLAGASADVVGGDLPAGIVVLAEEPGCSTGIDEGRAMMHRLSSPWTIP